MISAKENPPKEIYNELGYLPKTIVALLWHRGVKSKDDARRFLYPEIDDLHDPMLLSGITQACEKIKQSAKNKDKIGIVGDFDTDGITATVLMTEIMHALENENVVALMPNRFQTGKYGLTPEIADKLIKEGVALVVITDCGMSSARESQMLLDNGIDVIVVDHHEKTSELPEDLILVNPYQEGDKYPFKHLSACGVMFKLSQALLGEARPEFLELAALATIADRVPLVDENRTITRIGLVGLATTKRIGMRRLVEICGENLGAVADNINSTKELGETNLSFELLRTDDEKIADSHANELNTIYKERKKNFYEFLRVAKDEAQRRESDKILIIGNDQFSPELRGAVASRLSKLVRKPVIVYGKDGECYRGSARSRGEINLVQMLTHCSDTLEHFGGHPKASGFDLKQENLEKFKTCVLKAGEEIPDSASKRDIVVDAIVDHIDKNTLDVLAAFKPYGTENPSPLLLYNIFS